MMSPYFRRSIFIPSRNASSNNMLLLLLLLLLSMSSVFSFRCDSRYSAVHPNHTMCNFAPKRCRGGFGDEDEQKILLRSGGLSCSEKSSIVSLHNELRSQLARGQVKPQPSATNMMEMAWDEELASIAQRWADQCGRGHDRHRHIDRFRLGQNVAVTWTLDHEPPSGLSADFDRLTRAWFDEVRHFDPRHVEPFVFSKKLGHYTQMAWAETRLVGCGFTYFREKKRGFTKMYVCNYGPQGNVIGGSMYKQKLLNKTRSCDASRGYRNSPTYPGLCRTPEVDYREPCQQANGGSFLASMKPQKHPFHPIHNMIFDASHSHHNLHHDMHGMMTKMVKSMMKTAKKIDPFEIFKRRWNG